MFSKSLSSHTPALVQQDHGGQQVSPSRSLSVVWTPLHSSRLDIVVIPHHKVILRDGLLAQEVSFKPSFTNVRSWDFAKHTEHDPEFKQNLLKLVALQSLVSSLPICAELDEPGLIGMTHSNAILDSCLEIQLVCSD